MENRNRGNGDRGGALFGGGGWVFWVVLWVGLCGLALPLSASSHLVVVEQPDGQIMLVEPVAVEVGERLVVMTMPDGIRKGVMPELVLELIELPGGGAESWEEETLVALRARLGVVRRLYAGVEDEVDRILEGWQRQVDAVTDAERAREEAEQVALEQAQAERAALVAVAYKPALPEEEVRRKVLAGRAFASAHPALAAPVLEWLGPWEEHLRRLEAGEVWKDGEWMREGEAAVAVVEMEPEQRGEWTLTAAVFPERTMLVFTVVAGFLTLALVLQVTAGLLSGLRAMTRTRVVRSSLQAKIEGSREKRFGWMALLFFLIALGLLAVEAFYLVRIMTEPRPNAFAGKAVEEQRLESLAAFLLGENDWEGIEGEAARVNAATATAIFDRVVEVEDAEELRLYALVRKGWALSIRPDAIVCFEELEWLGRRFYVEYAIPRGPEGGLLEIRSGGLPLPPWLAGHLWNRFEGEWNRLRMAMGEGNRFSVGVDRDGLVVVIPLGQQVEEESQ